MGDTFKIAALHRYFGEQGVISIDQLHQFYQKDEPDLPRSTLRWRVHELIKQGVLSRVKRGAYKLEENNKSWKPNLIPDLNGMYSDLRAKFPYLSFCIWCTQWLLGFTHHMPVKDFILVDTERESEESVFHYLHDTQNDYPVYVKPSRSEIDKYLGSDEKSIVVRSLISQAPLTEIGDVQVPKLEKIMVDLVADDTLFRAYQGKELKTIYENILDVYSINFSTLRRYSRRRNKWNEVKSYLDESSTKAIDS